MDIKKIIETFTANEIKVLPLLGKCNTLNELVKKSGLSQVEVMRALQWLQNKGIVKISVEEKEVVLLDKNGLNYVKKGLPEKRFLMVLGEGPLNLAEIAKKTGLEKDELNACVGILKKRAAINIGEGMKISLTEQGKKLLEKDTIEEKFLKKALSGIDIKSLAPEERFAYDVFRKRKGIIKPSLIRLRKIKLTPVGKKISIVKIKKGDIIDKLTPMMIRDGSWKGKNFRRYDIKINVPEIYRGKKHFVNQSIEYIKRIWLEMGFKEMTGNLTATSFWNLDALFVPQDHPARAMQDTFFIKDKSGKNILSGKLPKNYIKIKAVHENGGNTNSKGWQSPWSEVIAKEVLLRTHTTVLSAKTIANLKKEDLPAKFFSVGKVFRNEAVDWKHLFELYQVEGIVIDENANFRNLIGYLKEFYKKMGYDKVRIRPAHFPYTEPSAEVEVFHPLKKTWIELGGCGIFRPEVVKPLLGFECPVLAWGLGLERVISGYFNITDIRDLYKNDLKQIRKMKEWVL